MYKPPPQTQTHSLLTYKLLSRHKAWDGRFLFCLFQSPGLTVTSDTFSNQ